jgi:signal peptidase II
MTTTPPVATTTGLWREKLGALRWTSLALLVILLDQFSKAVIVAKIQLFEAVPLLPFLELTQLHNTGAAFSFLAGASGWQRWFFIGLAIVVAIAILVWLRQIDPRRQRMLAIGLALILGGALGNMIDRVWLGHVIDFIHFYWPGGDFPAFNVADSSISIGAGLLILDALLDGRRAKVPAPPAATSPSPPARGGRSP